MLAWRYLRGPVSLCMSTWIRWTSMWKAYVYPLFTPPPFHALDCMIVLLYTNNPMSDFPVSYHHRSVSSSCFVISCQTSVRMFSLILVIVLRSTLYSYMWCSLLKRRSLHRTEHVLLFNGNGRLQLSRKQVMRLIPFHRNMTLGVNLVVEKHLIKSYAANLLSVSKHLILFWSI